ncbi:hypothetical protein QZH41_009861 [Actinostola sp. cb2023]|nr:hypothetical protein QZH41_009861 [Actinostola sp. cb2023]
MADPYLGMFESGNSPMDDMTSLQSSPYGSFANQTPQSSDRLQHGSSFPSFPNQNQATSDSSQQAPLQHFVDPSSAMSASQGGFVQTSQKLQHFNDPLLSSSPGQPFTSMQGDQQQQFTQLQNRSMQQFGPRASQMNVAWHGPQPPPSSSYPFVDQTRPPSSMQQAPYRGLFDYAYPRANSPRLQHYTDQQQGLNTVNMSPVVSQASRLGQQQVPSPNSNIQFSTPSPERSNPKQAQQPQQGSPQSQLRHYPNMIDLNQQQDISGMANSVPAPGKDGAQKPGQNYSPFYGMKSNNVPMSRDSPGNSTMDPTVFNSYNNPAMHGMDRYMGMDENAEGFNPMAQGQGFQYPGYGISSPQDLAQLKTSSILIQMQRHQQQIQQLRELPQQPPQVQAQIQQLQHQFQQLCHAYMLQQQRMQQNYQMQNQTNQMFMRQLPQEKANRIAVEAMAKSAFQNEANTMMPQFPPFPSNAQRKPSNGNNGMGVERNMSFKSSEPIQLGPSIVNKPVSRMSSRPPATVLSKPLPMKNKKDDSDCEPTPPSSPIYGFEDEQGSSITRRSLRERRKKTYKDDFDYNLSDDDGERDKHPHAPIVPISQTTGETVHAPIVEEYEETMIVEKILSKRVRDVKSEDGETTAQVDEFLVKYKNYSYLHSEWATQEKLNRGDKRIQMKVKRYNIKQQNLSPFFAEMEDEPYNPDYVEVDRVLDVSTGVDQHSGEPITHYLVKWRSLPYEDSTWEVETDVEEAKVKEFYKLRELPTMHLRQYHARPHPHEWLRLEQSPSFKESNILRDYQLEGVNWLSFCWCNRQNSILADEMGLGKTIQSIAFTCQMLRYGIRGPFLVIAPLSTISNWQREYETWSDMNVVVYHGSASSRHLIQEYEFYFRDEHAQPIPGIFKFQVIVTTYEIIIADNIQLCTVPWRAVIIDEAHRLKNRNCKLLEGLNNLKMEHRILLTGTPLQNNVDELFSLLNFLEPTQFPCQEAFLMDFGNLKTEGQVDKLKQLLKPMMLRRLKEDVEKNIAPKEETIIEVELTTVQKKYYRAIIERNFAFLSKGASSSANVPNLMNTMMELRKCCNHPFLINGAEEKIMCEYNQFVNNKIDRHMHAMIEASGKLVLIHKLLPKLKIGGHKVLVFSQMVRCLDILEDYLIHMKYPYERIDGRVRGNLRQAAIDRFSKPDSDRFVFLLCTRAGGLGINLTAADTVIIFDSDWNPQNDLQAQARCHRIGQSKAVKVYRLITRNSYEREMFDRASLKLGLDKAVLQSMNMKDNAGSNGSMSKREVEDLLKRGAYGAIMDEDSDDGAKFCEEDIDQILERRTQVIKIDSEGKGSTFAKASFVSARGEEDIDVDDPDFWQKWAKKADLDMDYINNKDDRIIDVPRQRKQTKRYGNEDGDFELSDLEDEEEVIVPRRAAWTRVECFRVEKNLLIYGWGRFKEILLHGRFKSKLAERDVECIARSILVYCLHHYHGDDKVKSFIRDIIKASILRDKGSHDDRDKTYSPITTPSKGKGRGKKGKNTTKNSNKSAIALIEVGLDWRSMDAETIVLDNGYKKHLQHHCNKILLRVRLLFYLKTEVIGSLVPLIKEGACANASDLDITIYTPEGDPPTDWWNTDADKSLLVGVFKHGYERYNLIRADPTLCFLSRVGLPRSGGEPSEIDAADQDDRDEDEGNDDPDYQQPSNIKDEDDILDEDEDKDAVSAVSSPATPRKGEKPSSDVLGVETTSSSGLRWPSASDLNTRLRRLVNGYQRVHRRQEMKKAAQEKVRLLGISENRLSLCLCLHCQERERKEKFEEAIRQKEQKKLEMAQKWSKREEVDFYRTVSTFGVEYDKETDIYDWSQFRRLARLDKKNDGRLTAYYKDFMAMCRTVCGRPLEEDREISGNVEPITEERASRCLFRIQLLARIREEVLTHEELDERLQLAQPSSDFPDWWIAGIHDKDLMKGVIKTAENEEGDVPNSLPSIASVVNSVSIMEEDSQMSEPTEGPSSGFAESTMVPVKWPKDRIVMQRLDQLCDCVRKGIWPVRPKPEPLLPNQLGVTSPTVLSNMVDMDSAMMHPGLLLDGSKDDSSKAFQVQRIDGLKLSLKKHRRKRKKDGLLLKGFNDHSTVDDKLANEMQNESDLLSFTEGDTDSIGSDSDLAAPTHRKPRKMKKETNFWSEHALSMDLALPHQQPHIGDPSLGEKTPKKRRRKKEDKGDKPDKPNAGKRKGRKPKSSKLGSAGSQDSGGTPVGEYLGHDWTGGNLSSSVMAASANPGMADRFGDMANPLTEQRIKSEKSEKHDNRLEGPQGPLPSLFTRPTGDPQRSNPTTPTGAATPTSHQFLAGVYNDSSFSNVTKQEDQDSSDSSSHSSPSPQPNSFSSPGYPYGSGYQHAFGHYGGVPYAPPYGMGVAPPNPVNAKSPVASSPSAMSSHFMFGNAYSSIYSAQGGYGGYPYLGLNNGGSAAAIGLKETNIKGDECTSPEAHNKPFSTTSEGTAKPQSKSPKTLLT